ncbi:uncharacterized protein LOC117807351 isoform X2 [Notolabrus celidotus]|uniref:uncharacterized protein LOC117807351 isoform X2 n=1 Tax=Notolabrus celidotus TaxID=1203425 RepID=UPI00149016B7|nr:uncharacterized protein LOC117807351 isoform X2 [Notolabrus celidotus]
MSHHLYNPYAPGNQSSSQGQYGLPSAQTEREPQRASSFLGPGATLSSSGGPSGIPDNSGRMIPPLMPQLRNYRPQQTRTATDDDIASSVDMHISRAREEVRLLERPMHRPMNQDPRFPSTQRDEFVSSDTRMGSHSMSSHSMSSTHPGQRQNLDIQGGSSSTDWLSNYKRPTADDPKFYPPPALPSNASSDGGRFQTPIERHRDMQAIPGLGDYEYPPSDKPAASAEPNRPKYTSEIAANILLHFGLEKEDLEQLISYPEDQITPANLPFILRQIRLQKDKRASAAVQPNPYPEPHSARTAVLQSSKVIDYGHTGKYTVGADDEMGRKSDRDIGRMGSMFAVDNAASRHSLEPLQQNTTEWKSSALGSSREQASYFTSLSSSSSSALSSAPSASSVQTKPRSVTQPNQTLQNILSALCLPKKDTDIRGCKPEVSKCFPLKEAESEHQSTSKTKPPGTLFRGVNPSHPGLMLSGRNEAGGIQDPSKTKGKGSIVVEHIVTQQGKQKQQMQTQKTQKQQLQNQQTQKPQVKPPQKQQVQPPQKQQVQQMQQMEQTQKTKQIHKQPVSAQLQKQEPQIQVHQTQNQQAQLTQMKQAQPASLMGQPMWPPTFSSPQSFNPVHLLSMFPGSHPPGVGPPVPPQPGTGLTSYNHLMMLNPSLQPSRVPPSKLPPEVMINDYAATPPKLFPHTCSLCNTTCSNMQDWITHQNASLHLQNCKGLCTKYPQWADEIDGKSRQERHSRSKSSSPRRHRGSESRRDKRRSRSRSRSAHRSRRHRRSRSWSHSRSRSPSSPRYDSRTSLRHRSRSKSHERRSSPRRSGRRGSTPRRSDRRGSTPRRRDRRRSTPRRSRERQSSPRRKRERPLSVEESSPERGRRGRESSAERLAKKLLETSGVQSLTDQSDLAAVVKTLAPALVAELTKIKSSSSSDKGRKSSSSPAAKTKRSLSTTSSSSSTAKKESATKPSKEKRTLQTESGKASPATMVKLQGVEKCLSHSEVLSAVEHFGKTKSVVLFRAKLEAIVFFEKEEDAKKLKSAKSLDVKGIEITVLREKESFSKESRTPPKKKPATSSVSTSESSNEKVVASSTNTSKDATTVTKEKVTTSEDRNICTQQITKASNTGTKAAEGEVKTALVEQTSKASKSESTENQPDAGDSKQKPLPEKSKTAAKESAVELKDKPQATEPAKGTKDLASKADVVSKTQTVVDQRPAGATVTQEHVKETKDMSEPAEVEAQSNEVRPKESGTEALESLEVTSKETIIEPKNEGKLDAEEPMKETTSTEAVPEIPADKLSSVQIQQSTPLSDPESKAKFEPETMTEDPHVPNEGVGSLTAQPAAEALSEKPPSSGVVTPLTPGEMMENLPDPKTLGYFKMKTYFRHKFKQNNRQLLVSELPLYGDGSYTEDDVAGLFSEFGFLPADDNMFVIPQARLAFVLMPTVQSARKVLLVKRDKPLSLKGSDVGIDVLVNNQSTPLVLYKNLMKLMKFAVRDDGERIVLIKNIPPREANELREALKDFGSFRNYLPLLNKVFIHFKTDEDAKRFQGWYDLLKPGRGCEVHKLDTYQSSNQGEIGMRWMRKNRGSVIQYAADGTPLTRGESLEQLLHKHMIRGLKTQQYNSSHFIKNGGKLLLITDLPIFHDGSYTEADVANLLIPFGFQYHFLNIHVVPQINMAFAVMKSTTDVQKIMKACKKRPLILKGSTLSLDVVAKDFELAPLEFYSALMNLTISHQPTKFDGARLIFIRNISSSETKDLREALRKISTVRNFLPLLNKVFIEFDSSRDTDRLGVWFSFLKQAPSYIIHRLRVPISGCNSLPPRLPERTLPDSENIIEGVTVLPADVVVPQGTTSPLWVTMKHSPFVFPTTSPWFMIPEYQTIRNKDDFERVKDSTFPTIMLTGLPEGIYKHEDVVKLVWPYFNKSDRNLQSMYYKVTVLPLQRRAFVFFTDWTTCSNFLREHISKPLFVEGHEIRVHFVQQDMHHEPSEEMLYKCLMKWSNAGAPDLNSLEERLLCVEVTVASVDVICAVLHVVASVAPFVNFLPLANRICIEMAEPSGVTKVIETKDTLRPSAYDEMHLWDKVLSFETVESLKQRLQDSSEIPVRFQQLLLSIDTEPPALESQTLDPPAESLDNGSQSALQTINPDGSTIPEPAEPSSSVVKTEEVQEPVADIAMDCTAGSTSDEGVEKIQVEEEPPSTTTATTTLVAPTALQVSSDNIVPAASGPDPPSTAPVPEEDPAELPQIDVEILQALTAAVRQHRLTLASKSKSKEDESPGESNASSKTAAAEEASQKMGQDDLREEVSFRTNPFDEQTLNMDDFVTVDEVGDDAEDPNPEPQRSSSSKHSSRETRPRQSSSNRRMSTRSFKDTKGSSSPSSKSSKGSNSTSASPKKSKDSSSTGASKASLSAPPEPLSSLRTRSSSAAQGREKVKSTAAAAAEVSLETHPQQLEEEAAESAVTKSAHKVSAEDAAAKSVESEMKAETSGRKNDVDQTDDKMDDGGQDHSSKNQTTGPKESQTLHEENSQIDESLSKQEVTGDPGQDDGSTARQRSEEEEVQVVDKPAKGDGKEEVKDKVFSKESCKDSKDADKLENQEQPLQEGNSDITDQPAFEILDSVDDQTAAEDATTSEKTSKEDITLREEEEVTYQILDSVEEPLASTETGSETDKGAKQAKKEEGPARKDGRPSRRSGHTSKTSKCEEKEKEDKINDTRMKKDIAKEVTEETVFEIVDSVEDTSTQERCSRRRSTRGKKEDKVPEASKKTDKDEEATFQILDSVEDETLVEKPTVRGRKDKGKVDAPVEKTQKEDTPTRRRETPARESRSREKTEEKESEEVAKYKILDSVEDEVKDDPPATRGRGRRGRPKKQETTKKVGATSKKVSEEAEEEKTYQIVDSVEDDPLPSDQTGTAGNIDEQDLERATKTEEEEEKEPRYEIVDSLEDDQVQEEPTATEESQRTRQTKDESPGRVDGLEEGHDDPCEKGRTATGDIKESKSKSDAVILEKEKKQRSPEKGRTQRSTLDEVSDEEEDYPDDTAEEEELRKRQAAAKERSHSSSRGGGRGGRKGRSREKDEVDAQELVTLDEVGAGDAGEGEARDNQDQDGKIKEGDLLALVTLDEFVEEETEGQTRSLSQEGESPDTPNQKISDEAGHEEEKGDEEQAEKTSRPAKRKHDDDTEESMNFVTVDEVGEVEEEEEEKEAVTPRRRGRAKRTRRTPVRKSTRGKNVSSQEEKEEEKEPAGEVPLEASSSSDKDPSKLSETPKTAEVEDVNQAAPAGLEDKTLEGCTEGGKEEKEERRQAGIKVLSKQRRDLDGPRAKRSRSLSPSVPADFKLPAFKPNTPLGQEFVVPKSGYFCNLCSVFYYNESTAKELHCSSQKHYDNLKKHFQKLQEKSASPSQSCVSD